MKNIGQRLILTSLILALLAAAAAFVYLRSLKVPKVEEKKITILVAAHTIPPRTLIDKKMLTELQVEDNLIFQDYIRNRTEVIGKYTKETILKNEGFQKNKLLFEDNDELTLKIDKTYRAVSINVTGDAGVSGLLKPGDSVDIVTYLSEKKVGQKVVIPEMAKVVLQNVEVLAVNKQLEREDKVEEAKQNITSFLVTLAVPMNKVETVVLAESIGSIKLALRPLKNDETTETQGITLDKFNVEVKSYEAASPSQSDNPGIIGKNEGSSKNKSSEKYDSYTVKAGDTLRSISRRFYGDPNKYTIIKKANKIYNENLINNGKVLMIPVLK